MQSNNGSYEQKVIATINYLIRLKTEDKNAITHVQFDGNDSSLLF